MKFLNLHSNQQGVTFIEAIAALGILLIGVIGGITLTSYNLNAAVASENRLKAANLAREGIEVIRQVRDSNWLAAQPWHESILTDPDNFYTLVVKFDTGNNIWTLEDVVAEPILDCDACRLYFDSINGIFIHDDTSGDLTHFRRMITLNEICWQEAIADETILANGQRCNSADWIGYQITSEIAWHDNNTDHNLQVIDRIYDWR